MTSPIVHRRDAMKRQTHHQFVAGIGYVCHGGPPQLAAACNGKKNCEPPANASAGSAHWLRPGGGGADVRLTWIPSERAWAHGLRRGLSRLAWSTAYLSRAGWEYIGPA